MIVRTLIVIPTYNNKETIEEVTKSIRELYYEDILIIDDGSDTKVKDILSKKITDLEIITNPVNMGKGYSIRKAFKYALSHSYTHIITIDADGQHKAKDIIHFYNQIKLTPFSLIIGKRKFNVENIPSSSKFGRKFSNFWVKYQTDKVIEDSQSGFRCYPLFHIQNMNFFTTKYDFEIEVLVRLLWAKVDVREIDTDVYYPPADERVSHFDKLWDNVKISLLNTVFVILSLLRSNISGSKKATSLAVGVFFAVQPIYGFQVFFLALSSLIFKLNFSLMFASSQISVPPMIPIWTYISLKIGSLITQTPIPISLDNISIEAAKKSLLSWITGSFVLGLGLAALVFIIYFITLLKKTKEKKDWDGQDRGGQFGNIFMEKVILFLGQRTAYFLLYFICPYFYIFAFKATKAQNEYFKLLHPGQSFIKRQFNILKVFLMLGKTMIDNKLVKYTSMDYFKVNRTGHHNLEQSEEGHIIIGAHTGGWLLAAKLFPEDGLSNKKSRKINIVEFAAQKNQSS
ncbi:MAG: DUF2062 domain-containing protein, partial [Mycoplasmataceae bacterium]|nr:DUF2062 domain-containing protein [Mycoplasmataceae bacterium]